MVPGRGHEQGFTVVEVMVAMVLFGIVSAVAFAALNTLTTSAAGVDDRGQAVAQARTALEQLVRDLRAANPVDAMAPVSAYDTSVSFSVYCSPSSADGCANGLRALRYQVVDNALVRTRAGATATLVGPTGPPSLPPAQQRGAVVNTAGQPVFTYFDRAGNALPTTGAAAPTPTAFRDCTQAIGVRLVVLAVAGKPESAIELDTRIDLRNENEVSACTP